ncbi:kinesin-like protein KIN-14S isoform X5 [Juglans microcarpa x Juglans regia]|uniref:kinesin-like protein KIN-14S isoform X5 n=1 Tax=Juglans microcarpa x Juglans regia TaxID=2249226 RepID=UPI001B7F119D|nr:kinesin-like protein KIN-14S isoform X5 [Juglans microcarpa x Juglans regia]
MDDRTVETPSENFKTPLEDSISRSEHTQEIETSQILETETSESGIDKVERSSNFTDENSLSNGIQETSPDQGQTLPILKKIIDLSTKVQELKKEYSVLSDQVKLTTDSFPGLEVLNTLGLLSTEYELLKKKYVEESSERKRLYNEVIELKGNIRVFCRCRPLNQTEITNGCAPVVEFDSTQDNELQVVCSDSAKKQFKFDHIFRPEDNQEVVFAQTKPIATSVLDGYNVCIFAYGQTGTGKTFTMEGTPENRGVNYRTLEELFRISEERGGIIRYGLFVSMLEVYNEKIRDLLVENSNQPAKKLEIKQAAEGTQEVPGLVEARVYGTEDVWELLKSGSRVRSVGSTNANELSSRSHCLLRVTIKGENLINGHCTKSHLWLVDLAGSERVGRTEVEGERLKESQFINKSLSALGDVISALASKTAHIPYRNSKLTHILQSSLGGDCKTLMFVQISPDVADLGETLCSLNFASRVRGIESGPARKQVDFNELFKYKQMAEKLKHDEKETKKLQDNLQSLQLRLSAREHICRNLQEKVRDLENQLAEERKTRLKQEARAFSAASVQPSALPSLKQAGQKSITQKKPPLGPSKLRLPLRRITNFLSQPSPIPPKKTSKTTSIIPASGGGKENITTTTMAATNAKGLMKPRRFSVAVRPPPPPLSSTTTATQVLQPRRRVSIATLRPEPSSQMSTPLHTSTSRFKNDSAMGRQSFVRDPRKARYSRLFSPLPESRSRAAETTPTAMRSSSKFMGSPPTQAGSSKLRHTTVVALQRKALVWSPLKLRSLKNNRKPSLLPSRSSTDIQCNPPHITY